MVKVTQPLGSAVARGHVGTDIIFQGTTAKAYRTPRNPNSGAQIAHRDNFRDITRTVKVFNTWARGSLRGVLGVSWWAAVLPLVKTRWATSSAEFDAFSGTNKTAWLASAPFTATTEHAGKVFYAIIKPIYDRLLFLDRGMFLLPAPSETNSAAVRAWAEKDLTNVFMAGFYDDDDVGFIFSGPGHWAYSLHPELSVIGYWGISCSNTITTAAANVQFYFYGTQISVLFQQGLGFGTMKIEIDRLPAVYVSQAAAVADTLASWNSAVIGKGLHFVKISQSGTTNPIYFDGLTVQG